jgi:hypothetical protein
MVLDKTEDDLDFIISAFKFETVPRTIKFFSKLLLSK